MGFLDSFEQSVNSSTNTMFSKGWHWLVLLLTLAAFWYIAKGALL